MAPRKPTAAALHGAALALSLALLAGPLTGVGESASAGPTGTPAAPGRTAATSHPPARQEPSRALDLGSLEKRLRETRAIGVFTKLSLKNQVEDLLDQFRAFHEGWGPVTRAELRERYDLLVLKVLSLVQDRDPVLARDIVGSREAIWRLLLDPAKFANL